VNAGWAPGRGFYGSFGVGFGYAYYQEQLGPLFFANRIWRHSTRLPIWSWKSLLFFITRKYASVPDRAFVNRAARFRTALIGWLLLCVFLTLGALWWQARIGP
jgi:hypothetical protein